jgi:hypothetical protein
LPEHPSFIQSPPRQSGKLEKIGFKEGNEISSKTPKMETYTIL